ncbi:MAG TPA: M23 family metallopeptidase [Actinomycetota bacterium]
MSAHRTRRASLVAALLVVLAIATGSASAETAVQRTRRADAALAREIDQLRREVVRAERLLRRRVPFAVVLLARSGRSLDGDRVAAIRRRGRVHEEARVERYRRFRERTRQRIEVLKDQRESLAAWQWTYGVFEVCPVPAYTHIYDDFGTMVRLPKVPVHRHMGSDITAPTWSPIRAPFDGYASGSRGHLGGIEVRVRGARGYVYNAHLVAYGSLGWVETGDVIGYVGATGDSTAPHDHLEWHPWDGPAVDPYPLLAAACLPV